MTKSTHEKALQFIKEEKQFHLGFLPTEQSHPGTRGLDRLFRESPEKGIRNILSVDRDIASAAKNTFRSREFAKMHESGCRALRAGKQIVFSGCGATGRLSILLESMWRKFFTGMENTDSNFRYKDKVSSIMTGGDHALIRSVENFEDYIEFGRRQAREGGISEGDVLIAISEGGETSSVIGTALEALDSGAEVFFLFNNPKELLAKHLERSARIINDPRVTVLELYSGPMAIAGSTRMQAVTFEMLAAGAALEIILSEITGKKNDIDYCAAFEKLLDELSGDEAVSGMASYIEFEAGLYKDGGFVTYFADNYLLDILTDTTERAPTFMLPPFRKKDDTTSPVSWAFIKNPFYLTEEAWRKVLGRKARCLDWTENDYRTMNAPEKIRSNPPRLGKEELFRFGIGSEDDPSRLGSGKNAAVMICSGSEDFMRMQSAFLENSRKFRERKSLIIGGTESSGDFVIPLRTEDSILSLMEHLAVKITLNTISSGTMVKLGRVTGNWMSFVELSNKKLMDRSIRLISELCSLDYEKACIALLESLEELEKSPHRNGERISPVQHTIGKLKKATKK